MALPADRSSFSSGTASSPAGSSPAAISRPGDESVFAAALREAREETGIDLFDFPIGERILDVDVHPIPAHGPDPAHLHYDIRHLLAVPAPLPPHPGGTARSDFRPRRLPPA